MLSRDEIQVEILNLQHLARVRPHAAILIRLLRAKLIEGTEDPEPLPQKLERLQTHDREAADVIAGLIDELLEGRPTRPPDPTG